MTRLEGVLADVESRARSWAYARGVSQDAVAELCRFVARGAFDQGTLEGASLVRANMLSAIAGRISERDDK